MLSPALTERFIEAMDAEHRQLGLNDPTLGKRVRSLVASIAAAVFSAGPASGFLIGAAIFFGLGIGVAFTTIYTVAGQRVPEHSRGVAFGYLTTASLSGLALSPVVSGFLGAVSIRSVFMADAVGLAAVAWAVRRMR